MKYKSKYSWLIIPEHCRLPFTSKLSYRGHQEVIRGQIAITIKMKLYLLCVHQLNMNELVLF